MSEETLRELEHQTQSLYEELVNITQSMQHQMWQTPSDGVMRHYYQELNHLGQRSRYLLPAWNKKMADIYQDLAKKDIQDRYQRFYGLSKPENKNENDFRVRVGAMASRLMFLSENLGTPGQLYPLWDTALSRENFLITHLRERNIQMQGVHCGLMTSITAEHLDYIAMDHHFTHHVGLGQLDPELQVFRHHWFGWRHKDYLETLYLQRCQQVYNQPVEKWKKELSQAFDRLGIRVDEMSPPVFLSRVLNRVENRGFAVHFWGNRPDSTLLKLLDSLSTQSQSCALDAPILVGVPKGFNGKQPIPMFYWLVGSDANPNQTAKKVAEYSKMIESWSVKTFQEFGIRLEPRVIESAPIAVMFQDLGESCQHLILINPLHLPVRSEVFQPQMIQGVIGFGQDHEQEISIVLIDPAHTQVSYPDQHLVIEKASDFQENRLWGRKIVAKIQNVAATRHAASRFIQPSQWVGDLTNQLKQKPTLDPAKLVIFENNMRHMGWRTDLWDQFLNGMVEKGWSYHLVVAPKNLFPLAYEVTGSSILSGFTAAQMVRDYADARIPPFNRVFHPTDLTNFRQQPFFTPALQDRSLYQRVVDVGDQVAGADRCSVDELQNYLPAFGLQPLSTPEKGWTADFLKQTIATHGATWVPIGDDPSNIENAIVIIGYADAPTGQTFFFYVHPQRRGPSGSPEPKDCVLPVPGDDLLASIPTSWTNEKQQNNNGILWVADRGKINAQPALIKNPLHRLPTRHAPEETADAAKKGVRLPDFQDLTYEHIKNAEGIDPLNKPSVESLLPKLSVAGQETTLLTQLAQQLCQNTITAAELWYQLQVWSDQSNIPWDKMVLFYRFVLALKPDQKRNPNVLESLLWKELSQQLAPALEGGTHQKHQVFLPFSGTSTHESKPMVGKFFVETQANIPYFVDPPLWFHPQKGAAVYAPEQPVPKVRDDVAHNPHDQIDHDKMDEVFSPETRRDWNIPWAYNHGSSHEGAFWLPSVLDPEFLPIDHQQVNEKNGSSKLQVEWRLPMWGWEAQRLQPRETTPLMNWEYEAARMLRATGTDGYGIMPVEYHQQYVGSRGSIQPTLSAMKHNSTQFNRSQNTPHQPLLPIQHASDVVPIRSLPWGRRWFQWLSHELKNVKNPTEVSGLRAIGGYLAIKWALHNYRDAKIIVANEWGQTPSHQMSTQDACQSMLWNNGTFLALLPVFKKFPRLGWLGFGILAYDTAYFVKDALLPQMMIEYQRLINDITPPTYVWSNDQDWHDRWYGHFQSLVQSWHQAAHQLGGTNLRQILELRTLVPMLNVLSQKFGDVAPEVQYEVLPDLILSEDFPKTQHWHYEWMRPRSDIQQAVEEFRDHIRQLTPLAEQTIPDLFPIASMYSSKRQGSEPHKIEAKNQDKKYDVSWEWEDVLHVTRTSYPKKSMPLFINHKGHILNPDHPLNMVIRLEIPEGVLPCRPEKVIVVDRSGHQKVFRAQFVDDRLQRVFRRPAMPAHLEGTIDLNVFCNIPAAQTTLWIFEKEHQVVLKKNNPAQEELWQQDLSDFKKTILAKIQQNQPLMVTIGSTKVHQKRLSKTRPWALLHSSDGDSPKGALPSLSIPIEWFGSPRPSSMWNTIGGYTNHIVK